MYYSRLLESPEASNAPADCWWNCFAHLYRELILTLFYFIIKLQCAWKNLDPWSKMIQSRNTFSRYPSSWILLAAPSMDVFITAPVLGLLLTIILKINGILEDCSREACSISTQPFALSREFLLKMIDCPTGIYYITGGTYVRRGATHQYHTFTPPVTRESTHPFQYFAACIGAEWNFYRVLRCFVVACDCATFCFWASSSCCRIIYDLISRVLERYRCKTCGSYVFVDK